MLKVWLGAALVVAAAALVLIFLPIYVEASMNKVLRPGPYPISDRARQLARTAFIADLHADSLLWGRDLNRRGTRGEVDVPRLIEGNIALQAFTLVTRSPRGLNFTRNASDAPDNITLIAVLEGWPTSAWHSLTARALYQASRFDRTVAASRGRLIPIRTRGDLDRYMDLRRTRTDVTAGFLGVEGAHALDGNLDNIDALYDAGIRMMSHTHLFDNDMGGAAAGTQAGGLSEKGRDLVRRMEQKHILLDVAHVSERTLDDILALATRPLVSSHTGVKGTCDNSRNLSDRHLQGIAHSGGVAAIAYFSQAVCGNDTKAIARAIRHAASVAGVDHVALGSDYDGAVQVPFDTTGVAMIFDALFEQGFNEQDVTKIAGANAVRVLREVLPQ